MKMESMFCAGCGYKCPHPYALLMGKRYCSFNCYRLGLKEVAMIKFKHVCGNCSNEIQGNPFYFFTNGTPVCCEHCRLKYAEDHKYEGSHYQQATLHKPD